ncbi:uncharacterized protein LOC111444848 isoform X2 [Cucurbita moschata]|uniref:Uncharacterized protein LOC111444848 isoform X1 n=1 Tax=Cucurbita moschata TaxID=3662 RepID=A0A6J1FET9_CUCMO|nr:uncharacterized protein LOC111444848 isoform X1 [Cucurbita moschata]XP_022938694.1 uncharacterized protein LOC111444848 isoform X1 [Cucurbita moschata]XP_022938696.1 uncharacterized protein LOC111444848 isoform X1 [Cucurbita moschata]XP_022938697.1 uncharacterized protein LOC111444848 isoform X2 [Cucurbita moschata]
MAAESNRGFHQTLSSALNRHAISFQSTATTSSSEMMTMENYFGVNNALDIMFSGNSNVVNNNNHPVISQATNSSGSLLLDTVPGLKNDAGLAVEWSVEEQFKLEEGLVMFADEPSILRYIKIAATLRDKTVRDVALRCRWMTRKRRKPEEHIGKKAINRKDKLMEPSLKINTPSAPGPSMAAYSHMMQHHMNGKERAPSEVSEISSAAAHLLEQNAQAFSQITANLSVYKLQDNIDLFCRTRNNIIAILNEMRETPGILSKMLPLPVSINEDLANRILPSTT